MNNEQLIIMHREELEQIMSDVVKNAVLSALREKAEEETELDEYYTVRELATKWRMSEQTIWRHVKLGHLHTVRIGNRVLFRKSEINEVGNLKYTRKRESGPNLTV